MFLLAIFSIAPNASERSYPVSTEAADGFILNGELTKFNDDSTSIMLLHQCNRNKEMWNPLTKELHKFGISTLVWDLRGYSTSAKGKYDSSTDQGWDDSTAHFKSDIVFLNKAWRTYLPESKARFVVGASCGGGLSLYSFIEHDDIQAGIFLSPSFRDRWLAEASKSKVNAVSQKPIFVIASELDKNAMKAIEWTFTYTKSEHSKKLVYKGRAHGEPLFTKDPTLVFQMTRWIRSLNTIKDAI